TDEVAARASVSKQTLYKHFPDKRQLFAAVILDTTTQVVDGLSAAAAGTLDDAQDPRKALRALADGLLRGLLQPDFLRLRRLVIAEADRFLGVCKGRVGPRLRRRFVGRGRGTAAPRGPWPAARPQRPDAGRLPVRWPRHVPPDEPGHVQRDGRSPARRRARPHRRFGRRRVP